jgi:uncharacterized coiled-coil DUF342 family protein
VTNNSNGINNGKNGDSNINDLRDDTSILLKKIENLTATNIEIKKSVNFCFEKIDDYGKKIDSLFKIENSKR